MKPTTDLPSEAGYYLRRNHGRDRNWAVWKMKPIAGLMMGMCMGSTYMVKAENIKGEWLGPFELKDLVVWLEDSC